MATDKTGVNAVVTLALFRNLYISSNHGKKREEVAAVEEFIYLGSLVHSTTHNSPDISRRNAITLAEFTQPDLEVKNVHFNQAEAV